jgi:hypothetical protein
MTQEQIKELALKVYPVVTTNDYDWNCTKRVAFITGFNKASELLYSEEQLRLALSEAFKANQEGYQITSDEIIQSLKQQV